MKLTTFAVMFVLILDMTKAFKDAIRLYKHLIEDSSYNNLIRPVRYNSDVLTVYMGLKLSQLSEVNMRSQTVTTNLWVEQQWVDINLRWDPKDYNGVTKLYIPSDKIWVPDIVLFNNVDGKYEITIKTKAAVFHDGVVKWKPPAIYKSSCEIDIEFFPYDIQKCFLTFASWTYEGNKVDLKHMSQMKVRNPPNSSGTVDIDYAVDLQNFYDSVEFDILELSAKRTLISIHQPFPQVTYTIIMRRKTLFYTVNLMLPSVAICFLSVLAFYLPSESGEKVYLSITILFSLTLFFLLLVETTPSTSLVIPLIGKYLLFTMILVSLSIILTVYVLNVNFRSSASHEMPNWVRSVFLGALPKLLLIDRPNRTLRSISNRKVFNNLTKIFSDDNMPCTSNNASSRLMHVDFSDHTFTSHLTHDSATISTDQRPNFYKTPKTNVQNDTLDGIDGKLNRAIDEIEYVANNLRLEDLDNDIKEDWKFVATVMDRLFLWTFAGACFMSTCGIIMQSPALYDTRTPMHSYNVPNITNIYYHDEFGTYNEQIYQ